MDARSDSASSGRASGSSEEPRDTITTGWSDECACYRCRDGVTLEIPKMAAIRYARDRKSDTLKARLSIQDIIFSGDAKEIIRSKDCVRTVTFPLTVRVVR